MPTKIRNVDPTGATREILDTGQVVRYGEEVEIEDSDLAENLLQQEEVWARPTTKAAQQAAKVAKRRPKSEPAGHDVTEPGPVTEHLNEGTE